MSIIKLKKHKKLKKRDAKKLKILYLAIKVVIVLALT
jgi:hypothetical protein